MLDLNKISPILFCGHRASGGGMYSGIFDFHPQLLVYPHESKFFQIFYPFTELMKFTKKEKIDYIINKNLILRHQFFEVCKANKDYFDFDQFIKIFKISETENLQVLGMIILKLCLKLMLKLHHRNLMMLNII